MRRVYVIYTTAIFAIYICTYTHHTPITIIYIEYVYIPTCMVHTIIIFDKYKRIYTNFTTSIYIYPEKGIYIIIYLDKTRAAHSKERAWITVAASQT